MADEARRFPLFVASQIHVALNPIGHIQLDTVAEDACAAGPLPWSDRFIKNGACLGIVTKAEMMLSISLLNKAIHVSLPVHESNRRCSASRNHAEVSRFRGYNKASSRAKRTAHVPFSARGEQQFCFDK